MGKRSRWVGVAILSFFPGQESAKVAVAPVKMLTFRPTVPVLGEVRAVRFSLPSAAVDGTVKEVAAEEGDRVAEGQVLLRLETVHREIQKRQAEAELEIARQSLIEYEVGSREEDVREARAGVEAAAAQLEDAEREVARLEELRKTQVVTDREFTAARAIMHRFKATLAQRTASRDRVEAGPREEVIARARAQVDLRAAELAGIEVEIAKAEVRAPFDGAVLEKRVEVGHYVRQGDALFAVASMDPVHVVLGVPENAVDLVRQGQTVQIKLDALVGEMFAGEVDAVVPFADRASRTFPVKVRVANPDQRLLPGMTARASIPLRPTDALAVPADAITRTTLGSFVFAVRDGKAVRVAVSVGMSQGNLVEVRGELEQSDVVAVRGNEFLRPGQAVIVVADPP